MNVEKIYSLSEAHASSSVKGDLSGVGIFSNNANKSIYEFFEDLEIALVGWGPNKQRAMPVFSKHLTEDIKAKSLNISDDYQKLKAWLFKEYGSPYTIVSDIILGLAANPKPSHNNDKQNYEFYADITLGIARLDRLARVPNVDIDKLDNILYSRNTLSSLFKILPTEDSKSFNHHMELKRLKILKELEPLPFLKNYVKLNAIFWNLKKDQTLSLIPPLYLNQEQCSMSIKVNHSPTSEGYIFTHCRILPSQKLVSFRFLISLSTERSFT